MTIQETVPFLLALYQKVTLSRASTQASKKIFPDVSGDHNHVVMLATDCTTEDEVHCTNGLLLNRSWEI